MDRRSLFLFGAFDQAEKISPEMRKALLFDKPILQIPISLKKRTKKKGRTK